VGDGGSWKSRRPPCYQRALQSWCAWTACTRHVRAWERDVTILTLVLALHVQDVFNETRTILEPAGAVALAGAKAYLQVRCSGDLPGYTPTLRAAMWL